MSFSTLPKELVDLIADFVGSGPDFRRKARRSLLDLCLVSRQTRISAQRVLYQEPFNRNLYNDWERAYALLRTLNGNERLGHFVRDTTGIDEWLYELATADQSREPQDVVAQTKSWYQACLMCCPNLRKVDLLLSSSSRDLSTIFQALYLRLNSEPGAVSPLATLRELTFPYNLDEDSTIPLEFDYTHVFNLLSLSSIRSLDEVYFGDVAWLRGGPRSTSPCFPFPVKALSIHSRSNRLADSAHLFPKDPSTLRHLTFDGPIDPEGTELLSLSSLVGSHLESLSLSFPPSSSKPRLTTYAQPSSLPRIPLDAFSTFPHLITLDLRNFHGPSLRLLETLARNSPLLRQISFSSSRWIADSNRLSKNPDEIFPEVRILAALVRFPHLRNFDPGTLPADNPGRFEPFRKATQEIGIRLEYDLCEVEEEED